MTESLTELLDLYENDQFEQLQELGYDDSDELCQHLAFSVRDKLAEIERLETELERLKGMVYTSEPGDNSQVQQAHAWSKVWQWCWDRGMGSYLPEGLGTSTDRVFGWLEEVHGVRAGL